MNLQETRPSAPPSQGRRWARRWGSIGLLLIALALLLWWLHRSAGIGGRRPAPAASGDAPVPDSSSPRSVSTELSSVPPLLPDSASSTGFEPSESFGRRTLLYALRRAGRDAGGFRIELSEGQEGMVAFHFRRTGAGRTTSGSVTTRPTLLYRYARLAVAAERGAAEPLSTVLAPGVEAFEAAVRGGPTPPGYESEGETEVAGLSGVRFVASGGGAEREVVVSSELPFPLRVRNRQEDGTEVSAEVVSVTSP